MEGQIVEFLPGAWRYFRTVTFRRNGAASDESLTPVDCCRMPSAVSQQRRRGGPERPPQFAAPNGRRPHGSEKISALSASRADISVTGAQFTERGARPGNDAEGHFRTRVQVPRRSNYGGRRPSGLILADHICHKLNTFFSITAPAHISSGTYSLHLRAGDGTWNCRLTTVQGDPVLPTSASPYKQIFLQK